MSKKTLRPVIFDIDGVLADFICGYTSLAVRLGHRESPINHEDVVSWNEFEYPGVWNEIHKSSDFWSDLPAMINFTTFDRINDLQRRRPVYFVTSRPHTVEVKKQTHKWLILHGIYDSAVIISSRKGRIAAALDAAYLLDDKAGNAVYTAYESPNTEVYLLDHKYNRFDHDVLGSQVRRIASVETFLDIVEAE